MGLRVLDFDFEEIFGRAVDFFKGLLAGFRHGLHCGWWWRDGLGLMNRWERVAQMLAEGFFEQRRYRSFLIRSSQVWKIRLEGACECFM